MQMINDQGGINGRKINLISVDDGFLTWRTGNETRKLIEVDHVAFTFGSIVEVYTISHGPVTLAIRQDGGWLCLTD
jgi:ABC-type branched-subunit amino acid transport system substrate-binding protein